MSTQESVKPLKGIAPYLGGKRQLAKKLVQIINETEHKIYAEPFVGMGGVFFRRDHKAKTEVINDYSGEVANLFKVVQNHLEPFLDLLAFQINSRKLFDVNKIADLSMLTDLQRAVRFYVLQKQSFGGHAKHNSFGVSLDGRARLDVYKMRDELKAFHERLNSVYIENLDYADLIKRYDREGTLFYLDPPYFGNENDYGKNMFSRGDFQKMADILTNIKGKFILSINNTPEIREIFGAFDQEEVTLTYSISKSNSTQARELIIKGW